MELLIDSHHGIYVPRTFARAYSHLIINADEIQDSLDICLSGPDHSEYWEAWEEVLNSARLMGDPDQDMSTEYTLHQDGDLWAIAEGETIGE